MAIAHANTEYLFSGVVMRFILTGARDGRQILSFRKSKQRQLEFARSRTCAGR